jgi:signal transduction histidine kinase/ligand-binding sensor domain-containing protein
MDAEMKPRRRVAAFVLVLSTAGSALAAQSWPDGSRLRTWTANDGLPQNSVTAVARAADGYLWVGTQQGLVRFDGARFVPFELIPQSGLRDGSITVIQAVDATLWVATDIALYRGGNDGFREILTADGRSLAIVSTILRDQAGVLWIGTTEGLFQIDGEVARHHGSAQGWVTSLTQFGTEFCSAGTTVWCSDGAQWQPRAPFPNNDGADSFTHVAFDHQGVLWAADSTGDLWRSAGTHDLTRLKLPERFTGVRVSAMVVDGHGQLWVAYLRGGIVRVAADGTLATWSPEGERSFLQVGALFPEADGSLWLGTLHAGLGRLHRPPFTVYSTEAGLLEPSVSCLLEDRAGTLWIGTAGGGLHRMDDGGITPAADLSSGHILSLAEDSAGRLWVGTAGDGVFRRESGEFRPVADAPPVTLSMTTDEAGTVWMGAPQLVLRFDNRRVERISSIGDVTATWVAADAGEVWFSNALGGVARWREGTFSRFGEEHGIPRTTAVTVHPDGRGGVWIGTHMGGLVHFDGEGARSITSAEGLCDDSVFSITEDGSGRFWMTSNRGIFAVERRQLEAVVAGRRSTVECRLFGTADGLRQSECNGGQQPSAWRDRAGRLWFATIDGAAVVDPSTVPSTTPALRLESLLIDGTAYHGVRNGRELVVPPGRGELELRFTSLAFDTAELLRFRHRLLGLDESWVETTWNDRRAYFTSLPPGDYRLQVQHRLAGLEWSEPGAEVAFRLRPAFVDTGWFMALLAAAIAVAAWASNRGRVALLRARQKQLEGIVAERTRELADINSHLEQRVAEGIAALRESERMAAYGHLIAGVAHEVRHPLFALRTVAHLLTGKLADDATTAEELGILERETDRMHRLVDDLLELGRPREMNISRCAPAELVRELLASVSAHADIPLEIATDLESELPAVAADRAALHQVLLNLVHNAALHATGASRVVVRVRRGADGDSVVFAVADDGAGIASEVQERIFEPFFSSAGGTGLGLAIARRLVREQHGRLNVASTLGAGTTFTIELPRA